MKFSAERTLALLALLAGALVVGMLAIFINTGVGQDPLQFVHPAAEYARILLQNPPVLRATIGLDNLFLIAYTAMFVLLALLLWERGASRFLLAVCLPLLIATGLLDMVENFDFLAMLAGAEQGAPPPDAQIAWQAVESMFKFHVSYLGLLLLGFAMPRDTAAERALATLLCFVQCPIGVAIYVVPHGVAVPLVFARFAFFLASFALLAWIYSRDRPALTRPQSAAVAELPPARAAGGSGVPA